LRRAEANSRFEPAWLSTLLEKALSRNESYSTQGRIPVSCYFYHSQVLPGDRAGNPWRATSKKPGCCDRTVTIASGTTSRKSLPPERMLTSSLLLHAIPGTTSSPWRRWLCQAEAAADQSIRPGPHGDNATFPPNSVQLEEDANFLLMVVDRSRAAASSRQTF